MPILDDQPQKVVKFFKVQVEVLCFVFFVKFRICLIPDFTDL